MKKIVFSLMLFSGINAWAGQLSSFKSITTALKSGKQITVVIDLGKCSPPVKGINGTYSPNSFMITSDWISFSDQHFTTNNPAYAGQALYEFITHKLNKDDSFTITTQIIGLPSYQVLTTESGTCYLNNGVNVFDY